MVPLPVAAGSMSSNDSTGYSLLPVTERGTHPLSQSVDPEVQSIASSWLKHTEASCTEEALLHSRKYYFLYLPPEIGRDSRSGVNPWAFMPNTAILLVVLDYLLILKKSGLFISSLKVHLSAITAFHQQVEAYSIFSHPTTKVS